MRAILPWRVLFMENESIIENNLNNTKKNQGAPSSLVGISKGLSGSMIRLYKIKGTSKREIKILVTFLMRKASHLT
jgi:hypothetical protein